MECRQKSYLPKRLLQQHRNGARDTFTSERGAPFTTAGFARMVERAGGAAILPFNEHPHMLRHACGFALANKRHDTRALHAYLGHMNIQHAVRYTELAPTDAVHGILAWLISAVRNL